MRVHMCTKKERDLNVKLEFRLSLRSSFYPIFKISEESYLHFSDVVKQISMILRHPTLCCIQSCLTLCDPLDGSPPPWTAHLSTGFSRQEYWSGLPCPPPGILPDPGIKPETLATPALAGGSLPLVPPTLSYHSFLKGVMFPFWFVIKRKQPWRRTTYSEPWLWATWWEYKYRHSSFCR